MQCKAGSGPQEPVRRAFGKTAMTQALIRSKPGSRGMELAAGLAQVACDTIAKALVNEKALAKKIDGLSRTNPAKSRKLRIAEKVEKGFTPVMLVVMPPVWVAIAAASVIGSVVFGVLSTVALCSAYVWARRVRGRESPNGEQVNEAKGQLSEVRAAKAELCAKTGLSERFVGLLQVLPLDATQKHTVLKQAIFQDVPEDYVRRVAGILGGIAARGEDLGEFAARRLEYLSRDISQALELGECGERMVSSGDNAQATSLFVEAAKALEQVLDYAGAAEMYKKASDAGLGDKRKSAALSAKSGECYVKAGDKAAAKERYEWAAMVVEPLDLALSSEYQRKAFAMV